MAQLGTSGGVKEKEEPEEIKSVQSETDQKITNRIFVNFLKWRDNRNLKHEYFRYRTPIEYWDDSNMRFNNYRPRPDWKDDWQANTSDITTHAKSMAVVSQQIIHRYGITLTPRNSRDIFSELKAQTLQDIYDFTEGNNGLGTRNGELDLLFTALQTAKEGTVIGFEGFRKTPNWEGVDSRIIPLEDFYPSDMTKFSMEDQQRVIWRSVINKDEFDEKFKGWYQADKVRVRDNVSMVGNEETTFFNISNTIIDNQVEILRYFDKLNNEFFVEANGILIVDPESKGAKLSNTRNDGELGFWKTVFEAYGLDFFYGRSLPDLMKDAQDGIDFLFNAMYDKEILSVMRPLLIGGVNQMIDDYNRPGEMVQMADVSQVKELDYKGADVSAHRLLKELQDRQSFVAIDDAGAGVAIGKKTATESRLTAQAQEKISTLTGTFLKDGMTHKARLRAGVIQQYLVKSPKFKQFIMDNVKLFEGRTGTRITRITDKPSPSNQQGFSQKLNQENKLIRGKSEIFEFTPKQIADFEFKIKTEAPSETEKQMKIVKGVQFYQTASQRPDQFDQKEVSKDFAELMDKDPDKVLVKGEQMPLGEETEKPELTPSLQSMVSQQGL